MNTFEYRGYTVTIWESVKDKVIYKVYINTQYVLTAHNQGTAERQAISFIDLCQDTLDFMSIIPVGMTRNIKT